MKVTRVANALGAEVRGLRIADVDEDAAREIEKLLWQHQVLFFPNQHPTVDQHVAFGEHLGELAGHPHRLHLPPALPPPVPVERGNRGDVGQPVHPALGAQRLRG